MSIWTDLAGVDHAVRFVNAGGVRTRALQAGTGEAVVFLHGTSGHLEAFVRNIPAHAERYACHAIDMLGHGYTDGVDEPYRIPATSTTSSPTWTPPASTAPTSSASRSAAGSRAARRRPSGPRRAAHARRARRDRRQP